MTFSENFFGAVDIMTFWPWKKWIEWPTTDLVDLILRYLYFSSGSKNNFISGPKFRQFLDESDSYIYLFILEPKYFQLISFLIRIF